jgi:hypothetical protein
MLDQPASFWPKRTGAGQGIPQMSFWQHDPSNGKELKPSGRKSASRAESSRHCAATCFDTVSRAAMSGNSMNVARRWLFDSPRVIILEEKLIGNFESEYSFVETMIPVRQVVALLSNEA